MWICVHDQILGPKSRKLASALGCSQNEAIGILNRVWIWGRNNADRSGKVLYADEVDIAVAVSPGLADGLDPDEVVRTLVSCGYIDKSGDELYIHDWADWQSYWYSYQDRKAKDTERKRAERERKREAEASAPPPAPKKPRRPGPPPAAPAPKNDYPVPFLKFWEVYPRTKKMDKGAAYKKWKARLNDGFSEAQLIGAAMAYASDCRRLKTEEEYIKHPKTFLSDTLPFEPFIPKDVAATPESNPYDEWGGDDV